MNNWNFHNPEHNKAPRNNWSDSVNVYSLIANSPVFVYPPDKNNQGNGDGPATLVLLSCTQDLWVSFEPGISANANTNLVGNGSARIPSQMTRTFALDTAQRTGFSIMSTVNATCSAEFFN